MNDRKPDWVNILFISAAHLIAAFAIVYLVGIRFSGKTLLLGGIWMACCSISITGGYHRLFAHPTYKANRVIRAFYLLFGAASIQNTALIWSADHRVHHSETDGDSDPYSIREGFWWAHMGWLFFKPGEPRAFHKVKDLSADPLIRFQHRFYVPLAILMGGLLPMSIGLLWGDPIGALLVAGFLRLVIQWHLTFSVNSFAHLLGSRPYSKKSSARDSFVTAILSLGEGYHNFHHRFQADYRNGVRWYQFDPTKWYLWTLSKTGLVRDLRRTSKEAIARAKAQAAAA